jgi:hypothetical protein
MESHEKFNEQFNEAREILDWAYEGFNASLTKASRGKRKIRNLFDVMDKAGKAATPHKAAFDEIKHVNERFSSKFAGRKGLAGKSDMGVRIKSMDRHFKEAIRIFDKQIQNARDQFPLPPQSGEKSGK